MTNDKCIIINVPSLDLEKYNYVNGEVFSLHSMDVACIHLYYCYGSSHKNFLFILSLYYTYVDLAFAAITILISRVEMLFFGKPLFGLFRHMYECMNLQAQLLLFLSNLMRNNAYFSK